MFRSTSAIVLACVVGVGCAESGPTSPTSAGGTGQTTVGPPALPDLSGVYDWSETTIIHATPATAGLFGLAPEGPVTHITCSASGELTIGQNGASVTGMATQNSVCETNGGVVFDPFPLFPHSWDMTGSLNGRSISFTVGVGFACHYRGSVRASGGVAEEIRATGTCDVPKELGHDKILGFLATRQ